jgi:hypothetical protein
MKKTLQCFKITAIAFLSLGVFTLSHAAVGGPDSFGYTFRDSNEPNGPVFNWIDITTTGTMSVDMAQDDDHFGFPLSFGFNFYGTSMDSVYLGTNGTVYFEDIYLGLSNSCIPGTPGYTMTQYNFIAHLWDDLDPSSQGGVYTQDFGTYFVISFENIVPCCGAGDGDSWQVILYDNGNILMQFEELSNVGIANSATVGIQNDPTTGLQYRCDATGNALANNLAVLFIHPTALLSMNENELSQPGSMLVYPNPANEIVNVNYNGTHQVNNVEVIDIAGRVIENVSLNAKTTTTFEINIADLSVGMYIIRLTTEVGIIEEKLMIK